jgi:aryl-alcohol dehydrogenase-like predicted oxidoreductase
MGMSQNYGPVDEIEAIATINRALDLGVNFLDTADLYGDGSNEELIGKTIAKRREEVTLATKFGRTRRPEGGLGPIIGTPEYVFKACDASLARLGVDYIDLYYQHRVDPSVPIEETWGALDQLVKVGKVRFLGISEASDATIRRAHAVHPIAAAQYEYLPVILKTIFSRHFASSILGLSATAPLVADSSRQQSHRPNNSAKATVAAVNRVFKVRILIAISRSSMRSDGSRYART